MPTRTREIRIRAGLSQTAAAALAGVSPNTWRLYEVSPSSVRDEKRAACDAAVGRMIEIARAKEAA